MIQSKFILINCSGSQRHKLHQTCISGFKIFKPSGTHVHVTPLKSVAHKQVVSWHSHYSKQTLSRVKRMERNWPWSKHLVSPSSLDGERRLSNGSRSTAEKSVELPAIVSSSTGIVHSPPQPSLTQLQLPAIP